MYCLILQIYWHTEAVKNIISLFEKSGYNVSVTMVNAKDYGTAQERKRVFLSAKHMKILL